MSKNVKNLILALFILATAAVLSGGLIWYGYFVQHPFEYKGGALRVDTGGVPVSTTEDVAQREMLSDDLVMTSGRSYRIEESDDGTFQYIPTDEFLEYRTPEGDFMPIETDIVETEGDYAFENTTNITQTFFSEDTTSESDVKFQVAGERSVEFTFIDADNASAKTDSNTITYSGVYDGMDVRYTVSGGALLEEIIVNEKQEITEVAQELVLHGVYYKEHEDGSLTFHDTNTHNLVFSSPRPVMYELNNIDNKNYGLRYKIEEQNDALVIKKVIDSSGAEWLESATYPIVIDLSIGITPPNLTIMPLTSLGSISSGLGKLPVNFTDNSEDEDGWVIQYSIDNNSWFDACDIAHGEIVGGSWVSCDQGQFICPSPIPTKTGTGGYCQFNHEGLAPNTQHYYRAVAYGTQCFGGDTSNCGVLQDGDLVFGSTKNNTAILHGDYIYAVGQKNGNNGSRISKYDKNSGKLLEFAETLTNTGSPPAGAGGIPMAVFIEGSDIYITGRSGCPSSGLSGMWTEKRSLNDLNSVQWRRCTSDYIDANDVSGSVDIEVDSDYVWTLGYLYSLTDPWWLLERRHKDTGLLTDYLTYDSGGWSRNGFALGWGRNNRDTYEGLPVALEIDEASNKVFMVGSGSNEYGYVILARDRDDGQLGIPAGDSTASPNRYVYAPNDYFVQDMVIDSANDRLIIVGQRDLAGSDSGWLQRHQLSDLAVVQEARTDIDGWGDGWRSASLDPSDPDGLFVSGRMVNGAAPYDWVVMKRSSTNFAGSSWIVTNAQRQGGPPALVHDDLYVYTFGRKQSNVSFILEKRKRTDGTLNNYECGPGPPAFGPPGFVWPACIGDDDWRYSSPTYKYTLAAPADATPVITDAGGMWYQYNITSVPSTSSPQNPVNDTDLCVGAEYTGWDTIPSPRYWGKDSGIGVLTEPNNSDPFGDIVIDDSTNNGKLPWCRIGSAWTLPQSVVMSSPEFTWLWPNHEYKWGVYAKQNMNPSNADGYVTPPSVTRDLYTKPRPVSAPYVTVSSATSVNLEVKTTPSDGQSVALFLNPSYTDYQVRVTYSPSQTRYIDPDTGTLNIPQYWGDYDAPGSPNWKGVAGVDIVGLTSGVCYDFTVRARSEDQLLFTGWSGTKRVCMPPYPPNEPEVDCSYDVTNGYRCQVKILDPLNGTTEIRYYKVRRQYCNSSLSADCSSGSYVYWRGGTEWGDEMWVEDGASGLIILYDQKLKCSNVSDQYDYEAKVSFVPDPLPEEESDWSPIGSDILPPCIPGAIDHSDQQLTSLRWIWSAPSGGAAVVDYKVVLGGCTSQSIKYPSVMFYDHIKALVNTECTILLTARDADGRTGEPQPTDDDAYTSIEPVTGIDFTNWDTDTLVFGAIPTPSNPGATGLSGLWFRQQPQPAGWTSGRMTSNTVSHSGLVSNTRYCYQGQTKNGDGDATSWGPPDPYDCTYTHAMIPDRPALEHLSGGESVNLTLRTANDDNPGYTRYAICVTRYDETGTDISKYVLQDDHPAADGGDGSDNGVAYVDWGCSDYNCDNEADCIGTGDGTCEGAAWDPVTPSCKPPAGNGDDTGHWATRESGWGDTNGITIAGLSSSSKYDFRAKARNENTGGAPAENWTNFGPQATLFLVKNNIVGWAWSSNIGWVSMNCLNMFIDQSYGYSCGVAKDWGLNAEFEPTRDINPLEGYAWSASGQALDDEWQNPEKISTEVRAQTNAYLSADKNIAIDSSGYPHIVWSEDVDGGSSRAMDIFYTRWNGNEWVKADGSTTGRDNISQTAEGIDPPRGSYKPSLVLDSSNNPHIAWTEWSNQIYYVKWDPTANGGAGAWIDVDGAGPKSINVTADIGSGDGQYPSLQVDENNYPHLAWEDMVPAGGQVVVYSQWNNTEWVKADGSSGFDIISADIPQPNPTLDIESGTGYPHIAWINGIHEINYKYWDSDGAIWSTRGGSEKINGDTTFVGSPSLVVGSDNNPHIAWGTNQFAYYIKWDGSQWATVDDVPADANRNNCQAISGDARGTTALRLDTEDNPHIIATTGKIKYRHWNQRVGAWVTVSGDFGAGSSDDDLYVSSIDVMSVSSFALASDNTPHVATTNNRAASSSEVYYIHWDQVVTKTGLGWISLYNKVCSDNTQQGCYVDGDCSAGTCIESAGAPPGDITYGFCYNGTPERHGKCLKDGTTVCIEGVPICPGGDDDYCVLETCSCVDCDQTKQGTCGDVGDICRAFVTSNFSGITREIEGWARILSLKAEGEAQVFSDWGWINFNGQYDDGEGNTGRYVLSGTEVDSQQFLGDPDVNPNKLALYSLIGWSWNAQIADFSSNSQWLNPSNVSQTLEAAPNIHTQAMGKSSIAVDSIGDPHIVWSNEDATSDARDIYYLKLSGGQWTTITGEIYNPGVTDRVVSGLNVTNTTDESIWPSLALDSSNVPHIAWQERGSTEANGTVYYTRWDSGTNSWAAAESVESGGIPSLQLDQSGQPHIAYRFGSIWSTSEIYYRWRDSSSGNWVTASGDSSADVNISSTAAPDWHPSLALSNDTVQRPYVSWAQFSPKEIHFRRWNGTNWVTVSGETGSTNINVSFDYVGGLPVGLSAENNSLALYADNTPGIVWREDSEDGAYYRLWKGAQWASVSGHIDLTNLQINIQDAAEDSRDMESEEWPDLIIDDSDRPHIVWSDFITYSISDVRYRYWDPSADSPNGAWVTISGDYTVGAAHYGDPNLSVDESPTLNSRNATLALDQWGNSHVAWNETEFSSQYCGAFDGDGVVEPEANGKFPKAIATDSMYMYIGGNDDGFWHIEKRQLTDGGLEYSIDGGGEADDHKAIKDIAIDNQYMYVVGQDYTTADGNIFHIEKRLLSDGQLCTGGVCPAGNFGDSGSITLTTVAGGEANGIAIDDQYMYVIAYHGSGGYVEKRLKSTGQLCTGGACAAGDFGDDSGGGRVGYVNSPHYGEGLYGAFEAIAIDNQYMYILGWDNNADKNWLIEKRALDTGDLVAGFGDDGNGYILGPTNYIGNLWPAFDIAVDDSYMYLVGRDGQGVNGSWHIEKRLLSDGQLCTGGACPAGDFGDGSSGTISYDFSDGEDKAEAIAIDNTYMYVFGWNQGPAGEEGWIIEKRRLGSGVLCNNANPCDSEVFGTDGVITLFDNDHYWGYDIAIDSAYMYLMGSYDYIGAYNWRVEKRWLTTGHLDDSRTVDKCTDPNYPQCLYHHYDAVNIYQCASTDISYSRWSPGRVQLGLGWMEFMPAGALMGIPWVQTMYSDIYAAENIQLAPPPRGSGKYTATYLIMADGSIQGISEVSPPTTAFYEEGFQPLIEDAGLPFGENALSKIGVDKLITDVGDGRNKYGHEVVPLTTGDLSDGATGLGTVPVLDGKVYYIDGDATVDSEMTFIKGDSSTSTSGNGLIIIDGDLEINANILYDTALLADISEMPSAAFIVEGNINVNSMVNEISGVFVAKGDQGVISTSRKKPVITSVAASEDDTYVTYDSGGPTYNNDITTDSLQFGQLDANTTSRTYLRWPFGAGEIDIPPGSEIRNAYIKLYDDGNSVGGDFTGRIYLLDYLDVDDYASWASAESLYNAPTSNSVGYDTAGWVSNGVNITPDIKSLVQKYINNNEYAEKYYNAQALNFGVVISEGNAESGEYKSFYSYDDATGTPSELVIEYSPRRARYGIESALDVAQANDGTVNDHETCGINCPFGWVGGAKNFKRTYLRFRSFDLPVNAEILEAHLRSELSRDWSSDYGNEGFQIRQGLIDGYPGIYDLPHYPFDDPLDTDVSEVAQDINDNEWATSSGVCVGGTNEGNVCTSSPGWCYDDVNGWCRLESVKFRDISTLVQSFIERDDTGSEYQPGVAGSSELSLRLRRGSDSVEASEGVNEVRSIRGYYELGSESLSFLEVDYLLPLQVNGLFIAKGYNFDRKYTRELEPAEKIIYDGRVVANTPPGLVDFTKALPLYMRVIP